MEVLDRHDRVERAGKGRRGKRPGNGGRVGKGRNGAALFLAIGGAVGDEFGRLERFDPALGADRGGENAGEIAAAHHEIANRFARRDLGKGEELARFAGFVAGAVGSGADRIGKRGGIVDRGQNARRLGRGAGGEC